MTRRDRTAVARIPRRRVNTAPARLILALALAAVVGRDLAPAAAQAATGPGGDVIVTAVKGFRFIPNRIRAKAGEPLTILFKNKGVLSHNLTIFATADGKRVLAKTPTIQSGTQATLHFTPEQAGTYPFWCTVPGHKEAGMRGRVIVR